MLTITVYPDEVLLRLDQLPRNIRAAVRGKFESIFSEVREQFFAKIPGRFVDQDFVTSGVEEQGSLVIGFIEATNKPGFYTILPSKARVLRFTSKSGEQVFARRVSHPFLKGAPQIERYLREVKPWLVEQLESSIREGARK